MEDSFAGVTTLPFTRTPMLSYYIEAHSACLPIVSMKKSQEEYASQMKQCDLTQAELSDFWELDRFYPNAASKDLMVIAAKVHVYTCNENPVVLYYSPD